MANVKISELSEIQDVASNDYLAILDENENETMKVKVEDLVSSAGGIWGSISGDIENQTDLMELIGDIGEAIDLINGESV